MLGIGRTKLWELTRSGALASVLIGRSRRYLATDLEEFLAGHRSPEATTSALAGTTSSAASKP